MLGRVCDPYPHRKGLRRMPDKLQDLVRGRVRDTLQEGAIERSHSMPDNVMATEQCPSAGCGSYPQC